MHIKYNTPTYRKLFKNLHQRYLSCNKFTDIEGRVRGICEYIEQSNLGVSVWSCEGHGDPDYAYRGYIMFAARNRESANELLEVLQLASVDAVNNFGWEARGDVETNVASIENTEGVVRSYPSIVIRSPSSGLCKDLDLLQIQADQWWDCITKSIKRQLRQRIELQQCIRSDV